MALQQRIATFSGTVQGVGFRYTACRTALRYRVTGYVRNLPDGRVECVAEGEAGEIDRFLADLAGQMADCIAARQERTAPAGGRFSRFDVRF